MGIRSLIFFMALALLALPVWAEATVGEAQRPDALIDKATVERDVPEDVDRRPRGARPDLGADEFLPRSR